MSSRASHTEAAPNRETGTTEGSPFSLSAVTPSLTTAGVSVVVMLYNEVASLEVVVREIESELQLAGRPWEILIVDDGSTDGSGGVADRLARDHEGVRVVHHNRNAGLGGVYRTGFARVAREWVTFFPADGQFPASIIGQFVPLMGDADMVLGYLLDRRGSIVGKALSLAERLLYGTLFGRLPKFQGVLMFRRALLSVIALKSTGRGWAVLMELIIRASRGGFRIVSTPTAFRPRRSGRSKVNNVRSIWANLKQMYALRGQL